LLCLWRLGDGGVSQGAYVEYEGKLSAEAKEALPSALNQALARLVAQGVETVVRYCGKAEALKVCGGEMNDLSHFPDDAVLRLVSVAGGWCPCGGTHVENTGGELLSPEVSPSLLSQTLSVAKQHAAGTPFSLSVHDFSVSCDRVLFCCIMYRDRHSNGYQNQGEKEHPSSELRDISKCLCLRAHSELHLLLCFRR